MRKSEAHVSNQLGSSCTEARQAFTVVESYNSYTPSCSLPADIFWGLFVTHSFLLCGVEMNA